VWLIKCTGQVWPGSGKTLSCGQVFVVRYKFGMLLDQFEDFYELNVRMVSYHLLSYLSATQVKIWDWSV